MSFTATSMFLDLTTTIPLTGILQHDMQRLRGEFQALVARSKLKRITQNRFLFLLTNTYIAEFHDGKAILNDAKGCRHYLGQV
jgi:hypothetical protein